MPKIKTLEDLYIGELKDLYSAETQLVKALGTMAKSAEDPDLKDAFREHLEQTKTQIERLEQIFSDLESSPKGKKCKGMEGLIKEAKEFLDEAEESAVMDAGIIAMAQKVEHYEIAGYGTARTYAGILGYDEAEKLLQKTLDEEKETDRKLNKLAESLNLEAEETFEEED